MNPMNPIGDNDTTHIMLVADSGNAQVSLEWREARARIAAFLEGNGNGTAAAGWGERRAEDMLYALFTKALPS